MPDDDDAAPPPPQVRRASATALRSKNLVDVLGRVFRPRSVSSTLTALDAPFHLSPDTPLDEPAILSDLHSLPLEDALERARYATALAHSLAHRRLELLPEFWAELESLLNPHVPATARHAALRFILAAIAPGTLPLPMRVKFYDAVRRSDMREDFDLHFDVMREITRNGREIHGFESSIVDLFLKWLELLAETAESTAVVDDATPRFAMAVSPPSSRSNSVVATAANPAASPTSHPRMQLCDMIQLLTGLIKSHFALFPESDVSRTIRSVSRLCDETVHGDVAAKCIEFLDMVVGFGQIPDSALPYLVRTLCRCVVTERFQRASWKMMKSLLISHTAFAALQELCKVIEDPSNNRHVALLRGGLFFLGMSTWGAQRIEGLAPSFARILAAIRDALAHRQVNMDFEVTINIGRLIKKYDTELSLIEWQLVFDILDELCIYVLSSGALKFKIGEPNALEVMSPTSEDLTLMLVDRYNDILVKIQEKYLAKTFPGPAKRFLAILERLSRSLSESSVLVLLDWHEIENVYYPLGADNWIDRVRHLVKTWVRHEARVAVRRRAVRIIMNVCRTAIELHSDITLEDFVLPTFRDLPSETDPALAKQGMAFLMEMAQLSESTTHYVAILDIITRSLSCPCPKGSAGPAKDDFPDAQTSVSGSPPTPGLSSLRQQIRGLVSSPVSRSVQSYPSDILAVDVGPPAIPLRTCTSLLAAETLCRLFEDSLYREIDAGPCIATFGEMVRCARNSAVHAESRRIILACLFRMRVTLDHRVYLLCDDAVRSTSPANEARQDDDLKRAFVRSSPLVVSFRPETQEQTDALSRSAHIGSPGVRDVTDGAYFQGRRHLPIGSFLEAVSFLLHQESGWQVFDFALEQFPEQLADKHLFCACNDEMDRFAQTLSRQFSERSPWRHVLVPAGVRSADIMVRAYKLLSILISYRRFMSRTLQESVITAFVRGLQGQAATTKPCVHALMVCCHELPGIMTKMMPAVVERLSRIMSSPDMSVHILEFLLSLGRLPKHCANLVQLDYQLIFGVALQYIKYSRKHSGMPTNSAALLQNGSNSPRPAPSSVAAPAMSGASLPRPVREQETNPAFNEYVLLLAYMSIIVWFLRISLPERPLYVKYIVKNLLAANEDTGQLDEQSETILDMLSRFAYANRHPKPPKRSGTVEVIFADKKLTETKHWLVGNTVLTVRSARSVGLIELTIQRPSGSTTLLARVDNHVEDDDRQSMDTLLSILKTLDGLDVPEHLPSNGHAHADDREDELDAFRDLLAPATHPQNSPTLPEARAASEMMGRSVETSGLSRITERTKSLDSVSIASVSTLMNAPELPAVDQRRRYNSFQDSHQVASPSLDSTISPAARKLSLIASDIGSASVSPRALARDNAPRDVSAQSIDPAFLFLQLLGLPDTTTPTPIRLGNDESSLRSLAVLERIPVIDLNKIGVIYVGQNQTLERDILANAHGSTSYSRMMSGMARLVRLRDTDVYTGGLDREQDLDGEFAYFWRDDVTHIIFHCATLMPTRPDSDPQCTMKKRHIGNDFVTIVYNDSGLPYAFDTITSQFNFCQVLVTPLVHVAGSGSSKQAALATASPDLTYFRVQARYRPGMPPMGPVQDPKVLSLTALSEFVRHVALHASIYAQVYLQATERRVEYVSNWKERLRQLRRMRERAEASLHQQGEVDEGLGPSIAKLLPVLDFTRFS